MGWVVCAKPKPPLIMFYGKVANILQKESLFMKNGVSLESKIFFPKGSGENAREMEKTLAEFP